MPRFYGRYGPPAERFMRAYTGDNLRRLEAKNGGSVLDLFRKAKATQTPTLIVGLGGLGGRTLNRIKKKYIEYIDDPDGIIQFLAMDFTKVLSGIWISAGPAAG